MKILVTADWQACLGNLDRLEVAVRQILTHLDGGTHLLHLGDVKEHFNPVDQRVTNFLVDAFTRIRKKAAGVHVVRGNHDSITTADDSPSCMPLFRALRVDTIADAEWRMISLMEEDTSDKADVLVGRLWMVPYFRDVDRQKKAFGEAHRLMKARKQVARVPDILAFHNEVSGCSLSNGFSRGSSAGISLADIGARDYDVCLGGHIHKPQQIENVHYVGPPFPMDWSEANQSKRLMLLTL